MPDEKKRKGPAADRAQFIRRQEGGILNGGSARPNVGQ